MRLRTSIIMLTGLMLIITTLLFGIATFRAQEKELLSGTKSTITNGDAPGLCCSPSKTLGDAPFFLAPA
jgi:hypothetical protein